jgi:hypothetical protein
VELAYYAVGCSAFIPVLRAILLRFAEVGDCGHCLELNGQLRIIDLLDSGIILVATLNLYIC